MIGLIDVHLLYTLIPFDHWILRQGLHYLNSNIVYCMFITSQAGERDCCDIEYMDGANVTEVKYRACMKYEVIAWM